MFRHGFYELRAVHDGPHEIGNDQVRPLFFGTLEAFVAVGRLSGFPRSPDVQHSFSREGANFASVSRASVLRQFPASSTRSPR
jgi:hypothetical protein